MPTRRILVFKIFFDDPVLSTYGSISFPYDWTKVIATQNEKGPDIYALQAALHYLGYYPPTRKSFSDCPVSGVVGTCTHSAITEYQEAHNLEAVGFLGPQTREKLKNDISVI